MDFDEQLRQRQRRYLWIASVVFVVYFGGLLYVLGPGLAVVWVSPLLAGLLSYWFVQHWAGKPLHWLKAKAYAGTEGVYHAYNDLQVRIRWNGEACEVAAVDVMNILRIPKEEQPRVLRRLAFRYPDGVHQYEKKECWLSDQALLDWLATKSQNHDPHVLKFRRWFETETFPALRKKVELGLVKCPD